MPAITLGNRRIEYSVVRGKGRRYTYLRFTDDAVLEVVAPSPRRLDVEAVIREREGWVLKHLDELSMSERVLADDAVLFGGKRMKIVFEQTNGRENLRPDIERGEVSVAASDRSRVKELVRRWFLKESSGYLVRTLPAMAKRLRVAYRRADVREIKNWGYCTRDGRLSFSWQLIALPERIREYVLYHELVHLSEHNHSGSFKRKLGSVLPDYRSREKELKLTIPA
ncbi:MAG: M48 family metallopeptidase [Nitrososphaerales archaeon]|nr:M48 family metallopeptidase [Nitrososphaerales archaeon]